jgi:hypothetical protein
MNLSEWVIVIPSIREINLDYLKYVPNEVSIIVVDDSNGSIKPNRDNMQVFDYDFQARVMGSNYDLIPHKTAACRNFGFYYVYKFTDFKYIITLDDDCKTRPQFIEQYSILGQTLVLDTVICTGWYNTIEMFDLATVLYARGYPYWERYPKSYQITQTEGRVVCHMGLWDNILDTDGIDKYLFEEYQKTYENLALKRPLLRIGTSENPVKFPLCAMNLGFIREVLPIMYQMPMSELFTDRYSLWRFDDIWAGYIIQTLISLKGDAITVGQPIVQHLKSGNLRKEILGEHYGHFISHYLYAIIDDASIEIPVSNYSEMYVALFDYILTNAERIKRRYKIPDLYYKYIIDTSLKLLRWGKLFLS